MFSEDYYLSRWVPALTRTRWQTTPQAQVCVEAEGHRRVAGAWLLLISNTPAFYFFLAQTHAHLLRPGHSAWCMAGAQTLEGMSKMSASSPQL